jgi:ParB-like chromosome segregation protein Spo0J
LVGIPDQKSGILPFSIAPIEFRLPEPEDDAQIPVAQRKDPLTEALVRARSSMGELANDPSLRRADIARREGLTRARVTQLLALNRIPPDALQQIRQRTMAEKRPVSIRMLLHLADEAPVT